jgi:hypothetical protein
LGKRQRGVKNLVSRMQGGRASWVGFGLAEEVMWLGWDRETGAMRHREGQNERTTREVTGSGPQPQE